MPFAPFGLVGSLGSVSVSGTNNSANTPAYGQTPTAGNLLILWAVEYGGATTITLPSGWTLGRNAASVNCGAAIFFKIAAGGDSAPSIAAISGEHTTGRLGEFSGELPVAASVMDQNGLSAGTTGTNTATFGAVDTTPGNLVIGCCAAFYSVAANTGTVTLNTVDSTRQTIRGSSNVDEFGFGWGISTQNTTADTNVWTYSTSNISHAIAIGVSFKPMFFNTPNFQQAVNRSAVI